MGHLACGRNVLGRPGGVKRGGGLRGRTTAVCFTRAGFRRAPDHDVTPMGAASTVSDGERMQNADRVSDVEALSLPAGRRGAGVDVNPARLVVRAHGVAGIFWHWGRSESL